MFGLFETAARKQRDLTALKRMYLQYGDDFLQKLEDRMQDDTLDTRSRKHWRRLYRKAHRNMKAVTGR